MFGEAAANRYRNAGNPQPLSQHTIVVTYDSAALKFDLGSIESGITAALGTSDKYGLGILGKACSWTDVGFTLNAIGQNVMNNNPRGAWMAAGSFAGSLALGIPLAGLGGSLGGLPAAIGFGVGSIEGASLGGDFAVNAYDAISASFASSGSGSGRIDLGSLSLPALDQMAASASGYPDFSDPSSDSYGH